MLSNADDEKVNLSNFNAQLRFTVAHSHISFNYHVYLSNYCTMLVNYLVSYKMSLQC